MEDLPHLARMHGGDNEDFCTELIHIYCLIPIRDAGEIFGRQDYLTAVDKILGYYKQKRWNNWFV